MPLKLEEIHTNCMRTALICCAWLGTCVSMFLIMCYLCSKMISCIKRAMYTCPIKKYFFRFQISVWILFSNLNSSNLLTMESTVLPKVKKLKINSPDSSFCILSPWHPTESPGSKIKNFYALGCVIFCDLANNMP